MNCVETTHLFVAKEVVLPLLALSLAVCSRVSIWHARVARHVPYLTCHKTYNRL
jgi:hypothetical protein